MDKQFEAILKTEYNFVFDRLREKALKENSAVQELNERFDDIRSRNGEDETVILWIF